MISSSLISSISCTIFVTLFSHFHFALPKNVLKFYSSVILLQLFIFLYVVSSFMYGHLVCRNCSLHCSISVHFRNMWTTFSSSFCTEHLPYSAPHLVPLDFRIPNLNYANPVFFIQITMICIRLSPILASYPSMQLDISFIFLCGCFWVSLHLVLIIWYMFFQSLLPLYKIVS